MKRFVSILLALCLMCICSISVEAVTTTVSDWRTSIVPEDDYAFSGTGTLEVRGIVPEVDNDNFVVVAHRLLYGIAEDGVDRDIAFISANSWSTYDYDFGNGETFIDDNGDIEILDDTSLSDTVYNISYLLKRGSRRMNGKRVTKAMLVDESVKLVKQGNVYRRAVPFGLYIIVVYNAEGHIYKPVLASVGSTSSNNLEAVDYKFIYNGVEIPNRVTIERSDIVITQNVSTEESINYSTMNYSVDTEKLVINEDGVSSETTPKFIVRSVIPDYGYFDRDITYCLKINCKPNTITAYRENLQQTLSNIADVVYYDNDDNEVENADEASYFKVYFDTTFIKRYGGKTLTLVYTSAESYSDIILGGTTQGTNSDINVTLKQFSAELEYTKSITEYTTNSMNIYETSTMQSNDVQVLDLSSFNYNYVFKKILPDGNYLSNVYFYEVTEPISEPTDDVDMAEVDIVVEPEDTTNDIVSNNEGYVTITGRGIDKRIYKERRLAQFIYNNSQVTVQPIVQVGETVGTYSIALQVQYSTFDGVDDTKNYNVSYEIDTNDEITATGTINDNLFVINKRAIIPNLPITGGTGDIYVWVLTGIILVCSIIYIKIKNRSDFNG